MHSAKIFRKIKSSKYLFQRNLILNLSTLFIIINLAPPIDISMLSSRYETPFSASNIFRWFSAKPVLQSTSDSDGLECFNWTFVVESNRHSDAVNKNSNFDNEYGNYNNILGDKEDRNINNARKHTVARHMGCIDLLCN